jgi:hypothetical protein
MKNYMLVPQDVRQSRYLFLEVSLQHGAIVLEQYADLRCDQCGKIDEITALRRGISERIVFPKKMPDFFSSEESIPVVSTEMRSVLESAAPARIEYFSFPSDSRFCVAFPEELIPVDQVNKAFRTEGYCNKCKRVTWCGLGTELFPFRDDFVIGAFLFECATNCTPLWIVCEAVVKSLQKAKLKGLEFHPYFKIA